MSSFYLLHITLYRFFESLQTRTLEDHGLKLCKIIYKYNCSCGYIDIKESPTPAHDKKCVLLGKQNVLRINGSYPLLQSGNLDPHTGDDFVYPQHINRDMRFQTMFPHCGVCDQQRLRPACAWTRSDQSLR